MSDTSLSSKEIVAELREKAQEQFYAQYAKYDQLMLAAAARIERLQRDVELLEIVGREHEQRIAQLKRATAETSNAREMLDIPQFLRKGND